jgi:integrase
MPLLAENGIPYKTGRDALTLKQVQDLLSSFDSISEKALIYLVIATGLRRIDIVNIKRNDFNPDTGRLKYYEHKKRRTRDITIPSNEAIHTLRMHITSCRKSEWLFPSPLQGKMYKDAHISDRQAYDIFNEHLDRIKIHRRPFHSLRATCIKMCEAAGWKPEETAELVGDTVRVIQEHYQTPSEEQMDEIARRKPII